MISLSMEERDALQAVRGGLYPALRGLTDEQLMVAVSWAIMSAMARLPDEQRELFMRRVLSLGRIKVP